MEPLDEQDQEQDLEQMREFVMRQLESFQMNFDSDDSDSESQKQQQQQEKVPDNDEVIYYDDDLQDMDDEADQGYFWPHGVPDSLEADSSSDKGNGNDSVSQSNGGVLQQQNETKPTDREQKEPLDGQQEVPLALDDQEINQEGEEELVHKEGAEGEKKKKKKKKKKKNKNLPRVEDVVDEGKDEDFVYALSSSADTRVRKAMERFRKNRIFSPVTSQILSMYFSYGGMDDFPDVIPKYQAPRYVISAPEEERPPELDIQVDFVYVVRAFLSPFVLKRAGWQDLSYFDLAPKIVAAFLRYLLAKEVVPEHRDQVEEALAIAIKAHDETRRCNEFNLAMDPFHFTCSILFTQEHACEDLPDESLELLEQVAGLKSAKEAKVLSHRFVWAKLVEKETTTTAATTTATTSSSSSRKQDEQISEQSANDDSSPPSLVRPSYVMLKLQECNSDGSERPPHPYSTQGLLHLNMAADIAASLEPGMILHGKFFQLSTGLLFVRPVTAYPTFHVEEDEDGVHIVKDW
ncbi:hypothetical protein BG004_008045 [Podila humilis]|nr:hypothetical protein BG004_008045 [Podila humilis]